MEGDRGSWKEILSQNFLVCPGLENAEGCVNLDGKMILILCEEDPKSW
jgi:hypothetical protein